MFKNNAVYRIMLNDLNSEFTEPADAPAAHSIAIKLLQKYFAGGNPNFGAVQLYLKDLDINSIKIYNFLMKNVRYGTTATYSDLAAGCGLPKTAARYIGRIMKNNRIPIIIPCHRVVSKRGLGGYNGGTEKKKFLLQLEGAVW